MAIYILKIEARPYGAIGAFQTSEIWIEADNADKAKDMALDLCRRNNLEPRFITRTTQTEEN